MAYGSGTLTTANPAPDMANVIRTALEGAGWVFVEDYVAVNNVTYRVMRSPAAANSFAQDFYLAIWWSSGASVISLGAFEIYDSVAHTVRHPAVRSKNSAPGSAPPDLYALTDAAVVISSAGLCSFNLTLNTTGFAYYLSATGDRLVVGGRAGTSDSGGYVGLYDPFMAASDDPFPLVVTPLSGGSAGSSANAGCSREPKQTVAYTYNFGAFLSASYLYGPTVGVDPIYASGPYMARVLLPSARHGNAYRGLLKDIIYGGVGSSAVNGDTVQITVGATTYTYTHVGNGADYWVDQAA